MPPLDLSPLPLPIETKAQLKQAMHWVESLRGQAAPLFDWLPETQIPLLDRQRLELVLSLTLVQSLNAGDGSTEARVTACQRLFARHGGAPVEAFRAGELLLRSRMITGSTDVETFWLAAAFAFSLVPVVDEERRELAWRYLVHAPFALDPYTSARFARLSLRIRRPHLPRWPLELIEALLEQPEQADLGLGLLEAQLFALLKLNSPKNLEDKLESALRSPPDGLLETLHLLARQYSLLDADSVQARAVVQAAMRTGLEGPGYESWLEQQLFDLPYAELYRRVQEDLSHPIRLDALYAAYVQGGRLEVARRLTEAELVRRLDPWRLGSIQPHILRAMQKINAGADLDNTRIQELTTRLTLLHARTRFLTAGARELARRALVLPLYTGERGPLAPVREELEAFIQESDPTWLLARERAWLEDRWDVLDDSEKRLMDEVQTWMERRFRPSSDALFAASAAMYGPMLRGEEDGSLEQLLEQVLARVARVALPRGQVISLRKEVEGLAGVPYESLLEADVQALSGLARQYARSDRLLASAGGAVSGLLGGPWGMLMDFVSVTTLSTRSAARIGACFGIEPGTPHGVQFLFDAMTLSLSSEQGEGLVTWLSDQRSRGWHVLTVGGIQYASSLTRRALSQPVGPGHGGLVRQGLARLARLLGLSLSRRQWVKLVPVLGAVLNAGADYVFFRELTEASLNLAARQWVLQRHGLLRYRPTEPLDEDEDGIG